MDMYVCIYVCICVRAEYFILNYTKTVFKNIKIFPSQKKEFLQKEFWEGSGSPARWIDFDLYYFK